MVRGRRGIWREELIPNRQDEKVDDLVDGCKGLSVGDSRIYHHRTKLEECEDHITDGDKMVNIEV